MLFRRTCFGNHEFTAPSSGSRRRLPGITVAASCCFAQCKAETVDAERSLPSQHNQRWFPATLVRETIEVFRDRISTGAATTRSAQVSFVRVPASTLTPGWIRTANPGRFSRRKCPPRTMSLFSIRKSVAPRDGHVSNCASNCVVENKRAYRGRRDGETALWIPMGHVSRDNY